MPSKSRKKPTTEQMLGRIYRKLLIVEKREAIPGPPGASFSADPDVKIILQSLLSGQKMLSERISSLYEFIEKSHDEMHAMVNGSDVPEFPSVEDSL